MTSQKIIFPVQLGELVSLLGYLKEHGQPTGSYTTEESTLSSS